MNAGKFQLIKESDFVLSRCGRFVPPVGSVVYIPHGFTVQAVEAINSDDTYYKEIVGDTTWCWRSISTALSGNPPSISAQVLTPEGQFLFNGLLDLTVVAGFGSARYLLSKEIECPPGSKIQLSYDTNFLGAPVVQPVSVFCGGAYAYYLKNGIRSRCVETEASSLPKIFSGVNQNILAPSWMMGEYPQTPEGFEDSPFTYGNGVTNVAAVALGGRLSTRASIPIDDDSDFQVRRFLFDVAPDALVTAGSFLMRIRVGSGYAFLDDYVDVAKYMGSAYFAKGWDIKRGDQILIDLVLVDGAGSGSIQIAIFADGVKRRRVA